MQVLVEVGYGPTSEQIVHTEEAWCSGIFEVINLKLGMVMQYCKILEKRRNPLDKK